MGYKNVCLECRKSFSIGNDFEKFHESNCPKCEIKMTFVDQKFQPPKITDVKSWELIKLLIENGFIFQSIYNEEEDGFSYKVSYPKTKIEALDFIKKYKSQVIKKTI